MPTLIESLTRADADARAEAIETYREILARNNCPEPTDGKRLKAAMQTLGFTTARLESDLAALKEADRLAALAASLPADLAAQVQQASDAWEAYAAESKKIKQEREEQEGRLFDRIRTLQYSEIEPNKAAKSLKGLRRRHWELFGEPEPTPPMPEPTVVTFRTVTQ